MGAPYLRAPSIAEILSVTRVISAAELLAFSGGAIGVVPPAGDGKLIFPLAAMFQYNFGTVDFSNTPTLDLQSQSGFSALATALITGLVGNGASRYMAISLWTAVGGPIPSSPDVNGPLSLVLLSGSFALAGVGAASIGAAGTGYAIGDTGTITTANHDATYRVLTVSGLGGVTSFVITFPGSGYATGNGQATATGGAQPGVGINFTIDVNSLVNGDGTIKVTTLYTVIDVP